MTRHRLTRLSDRRLLARIEKLTHIERRVTLSILLHLNEVERRSLHLKLGYGSLFDYCTERLGYSAPAAGRRIQCARCVRRFPQVYGMLERGEVNLMTVTMIAGLLTDQNAGHLLSRIRGKSKREVESIRAEYVGPMKFRDRVRPVCVASPKEPPAAPVKHKSTLTGESGSGVRTTAESSENAANVVPRPLQIKIQKRMAIEFSASPAFIDKFDQVRGLLMHRFAGRPTFEQVFDVLMESYLDRHSPVRRQKRREERARKKIASSGTVTKHDSNFSPDRQLEPFHSRWREWNHERCGIPLAIRDAVYAGSDGRCSYVGADGRRCNCTNCVQVDHIVPVARGGANEPSNLRLLCARHNRLEAERIFGTTWTSGRT